MRLASLCNCLLALAFCLVVVPGLTAQHEVPGPGKLHQENPAPGNLPPDVRLPIPTDPIVPAHDPFKKYKPAPAPFDQYHWLFNPHLLLGIGAAVLFVAVVILLVPLAALEAVIFRLFPNFMRFYPVSAVCPKCGSAAYAKRGSVRVCLSCSTCYRWRTPFWHRELPGGPFLIPGLLLSLAAGVVIVVVLLTPAWSKLDENGEWTFFVVVLLSAIGLLGIYLCVRGLKWSFGGPLRDVPR
jgi:hypothetical protein